MCLKANSSQYTCSLFYHQPINNLLSKLINNSVVRVASTRHNNIINSYYLNSDKYNK